MPHSKSPKAHGPAGRAVAPSGTRVVHSVCFTSFLLEDSQTESVHPTSRLCVCVPAGRERKKGRRPRLGLGRNPSSDFHLCLTTGVHSVYKQCLALLVGHLWSTQHLSTSAVVLSVSAQHGNSYSGSCLSCAAMPLHPWSLLQRHPEAEKCQNLKVY